MFVYLEFQDNIIMGVSHLQRQTKRHSDKSVECLELIFSRSPGMWLKVRTAPAARLLLLALRRCSLAFQQIE